MKKVLKSLLIVVLTLIICVGCDFGGSNKATQHNTAFPITDFDFPDFSMPEFDFSIPEFSTDDNYDNYSVTVYVSRTGKIHRISYCSGMKYYTAMDYDQAVERGYDFCQNCY